MRWRTLWLLIFLTVQWIVPQSYIIKFRSAVSDTGSVYSSIRSQLTRNNSQLRSLGNFVFRPVRTPPTRSNSSFPWNRYSVVRFAQKPSSQILGSLSALSDVEYLQEVVTYRTYAAPNDSAYASQWNLRTIGIAPLMENGKINEGLPKIKVGVIDTGIDDDHPDLVNAIAYNAGEQGGGKETNGLDDDGNGFIDDWRGYDFVDSDVEDEGDWNLRDNDPQDENGHGTAVSGIIGATAGNGAGLAGIAPAVIMPLRAFGKNGTGNDIDIASAIVYAADNGADVINMSFGDVIRSSFLYDAVRYAHSKNVVLTASSGNDGSNYPHYPSDFNEVISTGSVGRSNVRSFFSAYSTSLDIMAPGEEIITTVMGGGYTDQFAGTSAAAPHTAGVAALIKSFQRKKRTNDPSFVELDNDEIRGVLMNSAVDAGDSGWDKFTASGILNAERALAVISGVNVRILSPGLDENLSSAVIPVIVTAVSPYFKSVELSYGTGDSPSNWYTLSSSDKIFIRDTLIKWNISALPPNIYQLRLVVKNSKGNDVETRQRIVIDPSGPAILSFRYRDSLIIGNDYGALVEARMDRNSSGTLFYRKKGETTYQTIASPGIQLNHAFVLNSRNFQPNTEYEFYTLFNEYSGSMRAIRFPNVGLTGFDHFSFILDDQKVQTTGMVKKGFELPAGYLLNSVSKIQNKKHVIVNDYDDENNFGSLKSFQFNGNSFSLRDSSLRSWVPRSFIGAGIHGSPAVLVQDRGISQMFPVDTALGIFFSDPVWGDSSDVWASQLTDLDGDALPEIIARSSSEFLIYKKIGSAPYSIVTRLSNPSRPLAGEAKNQFGPPKSIVGQFTGSGRTEILFADHDGDLMMYRQSALNSLTYDLVGVDSTELVEMSDYLCAGDFNGDGVQDIAVAGHNDLGYNQDREYNVPVWTVRVFSHRSTDAPGTLAKIWEQHFLGVRSGSGYDNGITAGKLRPADQQDALFISFNPQLYMFVWDINKKNFVSRWTSSSQSNGVLIEDFDGDSYNDFGFHVNGKTEFWSLSNASVVPVPFALTAVPVSDVKVRLSWNSTLVNHKVYRGKHADSLFLMATVIGHEWIDSTVSGNIKYYYAVSGVNVTEGERSAPAAVIPHPVPVILSVTQTSLDQLMIGFSFEIASSDIGSIRFAVDSAGMLNPSSSVVWRSSRSLLVTFTRPFAPGSHTLRIRQLTDASGMVADTLALFPFTASMTDERIFIARSASLPSPKRILIEFNEVPGSVTVTDRLNYSVRTSARTFSVVSVDSVSPTVVALNFANEHPLDQLMLRIEVTMNRNIVSRSGLPLNAGKGQVLSIAQESMNLENVAVYPNPVKNANGVSFVNIPSNCRITIFSPNGDKVKVIDDLTGREGVTWNLRDERGSIVSTGIYIYRVEQLGQANDILNTSMGKFAVIR